MNAEEARKKALKIVYNIVNSQYSVVKKRIEEEVENGKLFLIYDFDLCTEVIENLEVEGFEITRFQSGHNEYSYEIRW